LDFWKIDLYDDIFNGSLKPRQAFAYVDRLFNRDDSRWRAVLLHEASLLPPGEERDEEINKLRHLNFTIDTEKISNVEDLLAQININVMSAITAAENIPKFIRAWRPNLPADEQSPAAEDDFDPATLKASFRKYGVL
jgi:hypothetical protein